MSKQWRPIGKYSRRDALNMGMDKPRLVINTEIEGRLIVLSDGERTISTLLPVEHAVCELVDDDVPVVQMTPERVEALRVLAGIDEWNFEEVQLSIEVVTEMLDELDAQAGEG